MVKKNKLKEIFDTFVQLETNPIDFIRNTTFKRSELKLDPRVANHWVEKGLFPREYETGTWLVFNLSEAFWVKIIMKLREFNVSLEIIKKIKESFFTIENIVITEELKELILRRIKDEGLIKGEHIHLAKDIPLWNDLNRMELSYFEKMIISILLERKPFFIVFNNKGQVALIEESQILMETNQEYIDAYMEITSKSHIRISMNEILGDLVTALGDLTCSETIPILTKSEAQIIKMLRGDNISRVEIRYNKSAQPEIIEITSNNLINEAARLNELIISRGYQNITVKTQNGQIAYCENTIKHKLDTE